MIIPDKTQDLIAQPLCGLLIYAMNNPRSSDIQSLAITKHQLQIQNERPVLGEVQPFSESELGELLRAIEAREETGVGLIPANLLFHHSNLLAWYVPGIKRNMWIHRKDEANALRAFKVIWPNLIFVATNNTLYVFAYIGNQRPTEQTPLFNAPLMNVFSDGKVCLGNATPPKARGINSIPEWEDIIFNTRFSHTNHPRTLRVKGNGTISDEQHIQFWQAKADNQTKIKARELQPYKANLGELLKWMQTNV